jgi:hypothetical protein
VNISGNEKTICYVDAGSDESNNELPRSLYRNLEGRYTETDLPTPLTSFKEQRLF